MLSDLEREARELRGEKDRLREQLVSAKTQYEQLVAAITSEAVYATICEELQRVYTKAAHQAWNIRQGLRAQTTPAIEEGKPETEAEFIASFVARILQTIPAPAALRGRFSFTWMVRYLELPSRIAEDLRQAELTRLQLQAERERLTAELEQQRLEDRVARAQKEMELEAVECRLAAEDAVAREVAEKTKADLEAKLNRTSALVEQALRTMLYDLSVDVLGSLQKNGRLPSASARRIRGVAERVRLLNYRDDAAIEELVTKLAAVAPSDGPSPAPEDISTTLRELATVTRAELLALGATPCSGASVGIGETIDVSAYRRAREALSCDNPVVIPTQGRSTRVQTPAPEEAVTPSLIPNDASPMQSEEPYRRGIKGVAHDQNNEGRDLVEKGQTVVRRTGHSLHLCWGTGHCAVLRVLRQPLVQRARYHLSPDPDMTLNDQGEWIILY